MKKSIRTIAAGAFATAGLATAVVAGTLSAAHATDNYVIGGGPRANFVGSSIQFTVDPSGAVLNCPTFNLAGDVNAGSLAHADVAGTLDTLTATGCTVPQFGATTVTPYGDWEIRITGDPTGTTWPAQLANVGANVNGTSWMCSFDVEGSVDGTFNTATQKFTPGTSNLKTARLTGSSCATLDIQDGDDVLITNGSWANTPPSGSSAITLTH